ncbi:MAG: restriction endonuclease subunit S [Paludibacteraceae bacterium]|nr:restriction endonuclease subunit S [Paludibacteraceae bacterium]
MKIKDICTLSTKSIMPLSNVAYHLYSLPAFDENQVREEVLGKDILSNKWLVPDKCILFNKLNVRFKRVWRIENADENKLASTEFLPLIIDESKVDFQYCYYLLLSDAITNYLCGQNSNTSGSHKRIDPHDFLNIEISLPTISEQRMIGKILADIDSKISLNKQINQNLEALAKQLYDYWFVQFDFPDENGKPYKSSGGKMVWNEQLKREIPKGWGICKLDEYILSDNTGDWGKDAISDGYFEVGCIRGADILSLIDLPKRYIKNEEKLLSEQDIVIEVSGGSPTQATGRSAYISQGVIERNGGKITCSNFCHAFTLKDHRKSAYFYYTWQLLYNSGNMFNYEGKTSGIKNFMTEMFLKNYWIDIPKNLANKFFEKVSVWYAMKDANTAEISSLIKQRNELLPLLMNGQVTL